jgi:hypothetical protein
MQIDNPSPDCGIGTGLLAGLSGVALIAVIVAWSSWDGFHVAVKSAPSGTTIGSSATRPGPTTPIN